MKKAIFILAALFLSFSVHAQSIGIGTDTPAISAILDVSSATKGFLLPRMNQSQRIAISSPTKGLLVFQTDGLTGLYVFTDNGWSQFSISKLVLTTTGTTGPATLINDTLNIPQVQSTALTKHSIGEVFGGGIVFYTTPDSLHGLIAETIDQGSNISWYDAQDAVSAATNHSISGKNFTDWMPTKNELNLLNAAKNAGSVINFANGQYWSSTEWNYQQSWNQYFSSSGFQNYMSKSNTAGYYVRAIRSF